MAPGPLSHYEDTVGEEDRLTYAMCDKNCSARKIFCQRSSNRTFI